MKYVVIKHTHKHNPTHWDLMLEKGDKLETFQVDIPPDQFADETISVFQIKDHPLKFLTYQGQVNKGLGNAERVDKGDCTIISKIENSMKISFDGQVLKGPFSFKINKKAEPE